MVKRYLSFNMELTDIDWKRPSTVKRSDEFVRQFCASFGLKTHSGTWSGIDLESPLFPEFLSEAKRLIKGGIAWFVGFCSLSFQSAENSMWYQLLERRHNSEAYSHSADLFEVKAYKYGPNVHIDGYGGRGIIVSEKFKRVVEENGLTGVEFLWVNDVGRYKPYQQWYFPVVLNPIGRGIDHEWFDPSTLAGDDAGQPRDPQFRRGISRYYASQLRQGYSAPALEREIVSLFNPKWLVLFTPERLLKDFTPDTDFAFWWQASYERTVYVSNRARQVLLENRIASEEQFQAVAILDSLSEGAELLDGRWPLPAPFYSKRDISYETAKQNNARMRSLYDEKPKPELSVTLQSALRLLNSVKRGCPGDFLDPLKQSIVIDNSLNLPRYWIEVLKKTNGGRIHPECELAPYEEIRSLSDETTAKGKDVWIDYKNTYISIAESVNGDFYVLDMESQNGDDCKVLKMTHEGYVSIDEWNGIANFIYDMLAVREAG